MWDGGRKDLGRKKIQPPLGELSAGAINQKSKKCVLNRRKGQLKMRSL